MEALLDSPLVCDDLCHAHKPQGDGWHGPSKTRHLTPFTTGIDQNPPPPPRATSQTHRQHLIKQADLANSRKKNRKKNWVVEIANQRESTQTRDRNRKPTPRRPTATRANPPKILENPLQTATVEIAKREGVCAHLASRFPLPSPPHSLTFVVAAQLASPRLRLHRLASVFIASPPSSPPRLRRHRLAAPHSATPHFPLRRLNKTKNKKLLLYRRYQIGNELKKKKRSKSRSAMSLKKKKKKGGRDKPARRRAKYPD
uniref:Uncharacterized protein n=1 Tax=Fagus sylvatica TaxID=28930 RepID=A0A2N9ED11_FAGSY